MPAVSRKLLHGTVEERSLRTQSAKEHKVVVKHNANEGAGVFVVGPYCAPYQAFCGVKLVCTLQKLFVNNKVLKHVRQRCSPYDLPKHARATAETRVVSKLRIPL